jgi:hypothetical protein
MRLFSTAAVALAIATLPLAHANAGDLNGSMASMTVQHAAAREADYSFLRRPSDVERLVELGRLVALNGNDDYELAGVSFPYARAEVLGFVERLGAEYRAATGTRLVITSLTRPTSMQPGNAHKLSVHPAGMAVDLRIPTELAARTWLEARLLELEDADAIDVTRERNPPHYHVAVFAHSYVAVVAREDSARMTSQAADTVDFETPEEAGPAPEMSASQADALTEARALRHARRSRVGAFLGAMTVMALGGPLVRRRARHHVSS